MYMLFLIDFRMINIYSIRENVVYGLLHGIIQLVIMYYLKIRYDLFQLLFIYYKNCSRMAQHLYRESKLDYTLTITNIKTELRQCREDFDVDKHNKIGSKSFFNRYCTHFSYFKKGSIPC